MSDTEDNNIDPEQEEESITIKDEFQPEMIVPDSGDSDTSRVIIMESDDVVESQTPTKSPEKIIHIQTG